MVEMTGTLAIVLMMIGGLLVFCVMYLAGTPFARARLMRRFGKNIGLVEVNSAGRFVFYLLKNFDKDLIEHGNKSWVFDSGKVYRCIADAGEIKVKEEIKLSKYLITRSGVPMLRVSLDDMLPQLLEPELFEHGKSRNPETVNAALKKERAVFKLKILTLIGETLKILVIVAIVVGIINILLSVVNITTIMDVKKNVTQVLDRQYLMEQRFNQYEQWGGLAPARPEG
jgi:hypothetical protein